MRYGRPVRNAIGLLAVLAMIVLTPIATASVRAITAVGTGLRQSVRSGNRKVSMVD